MNRSKAEYFDSQVDAEWAAEDYTGEEREKIDEMLRLSDWHAEMRVLEPGCGG